MPPLSLNGRLVTKFFVSRSFPLILAATKRQNVGFWLPGLSRQCSCFFFQISFHLKTCLRFCLQIFLWHFYFFYFFFFQLTKDDAAKEPFYYYYYYYSYLLRSYKTKIKIFIRWDFNLFFFLSLLGRSLRNSSDIRIRFLTCLINRNLTEKERKFFSKLLVKKKKKVLCILLKSN